MRHQVAVRKLGRTSAHRRAMLRNMVTSLFQHERIRTTTPKAKVARRYAERMITFGKRGDLHARRQAARFINDETVLKKLFDEIAPKMVERQGGYTRIVRAGYRKGDAADVAILELVTHSPERAEKGNRKTAERLAKFEVSEAQAATGTETKAEDASVAAAELADDAGADTEPDASEEKPSKSGAAKQEKK
jgi:large subunit ribosomal protein L17